MSLLDAFKPKWQNSNPEKRMAAVEELDPREQNILERVALSDEDSKIRLVAVKKLALTASLRKISKEDSDAAVRRQAETRYFEEVVKQLKDCREASAESKALVEELKDSRYAEDLLKSMPCEELRLELVKGTGKANVLGQAAAKDASEAVAKVAVERLDSDSLLQEAAKNSKHTSVRKIAADKIRAKKEAADGGKKEAALLQGKRGALLQQAHFLAAQKDPTAVKGQFEELMAEANALGMGDSEAELKEVYGSFVKFYEEKESEKLAAVKAAQEAEAAKAHLEEILVELESLVSADNAAEQVERIDAIIAEWADKKSLMETSAIKRYNMAFLKAQEVKKPAPVAEDATDSELEAARPDLLERLQALADTDVNETTGKMLHAIVRDWEKLPLLEGEDPVLQAYNALRNKLSEKISAFNEGAQKVFEENSAKLRALITKVQAIDENEDFKAISLKLKDLFQEWKNIVGEQKFKYQELWLEYKAATSRFQEMRQWESWHNEKDREVLLEEMELLSKEPGSQDTLNKLRDLSNKWKNIGPISAVKFNEFREKFQSLYEKVKENCAPFIEEQQNERKKNLEEKSALCQKAEELVANVEIFWKDKFKTMQEIQEAWKNIGMVPKENVAELMERFKNVTNAFYAQHKENLKKEDESREANYQQKVALCEQAEAIKESNDWGATSNKLKQLQDAWKAVGPVPKSKSEEIWTRFRTACDAFFEKKRMHYEELDASKQQNLEKKQALCEKLEAMIAAVSAETVEAVKEAQKEWETLGMVPKDAIETISDRYNKAVNALMAKAAEVVPAMKEMLEGVKAKKQEMIEQVKQFAESAGSNQLADAVREIQQNWRAMGSCGADEADLHKTFREACDDFFTRRRDQLDIQEQARQNNLQKKLLLCEQAEELLVDLNEANAPAAMNKVKHFRRLWKEVGSVPRDQSDKVWKRFNGACDQVFAFGRKDEPKAEAPAAEEATAGESADA